jgi:hypothetical protein
MGYSEYPFYFGAAFSLSRGTISVRGIVPALTDAVIHVLTITEAQYPAELATSQVS